MTRLCKIQAELCSPLNGHLLATTTSRAASIVVSLLSSHQIEISISTENRTNRSINKVTHKKVLRNNI